MTDIFSGFCAGITQTLIGHPFDTIKVLIQNKRPIRHLKCKDLYRGWRYPMCMSTIFNATAFPIYERSFSYTNNHYCSGAISGFIVSPIVYWFDVGKIKEQTKQKIHLKDFYKTKGLTCTFYRETLAMSVYFGSYSYFKNNLNFDPFFAGGAAGLANWSATYPLDVIRSRQIAQNISIHSAIKQQKLWRGFGICATRAIIVNASQFKIYEIIKKYIDDKCNK